MKTILILLCLNSFIDFGLLAQGCSDAGVCSVGGSDDTTLTKRNTFEAGYTYAVGIEDVRYSSGVFGISHRWSAKWSGAIQVSYNQANGDFGTLGNVGDVLLIGQYRLNQQNHNAWAFTFGSKIPLSTGNMKINRIALPMEYQPSLGTIDALLSIEYRVRKWNFESALQLPIVQSNRNSYFDEYSASDVFPTTNLFQRKPDVFIRTGYKWQTKNEKWTFKPNIMGIYHLGNDTYEDYKGQRREIDNSNGLTVNASWFTAFTINDRNGVELNVAFPLLVRQKRPDGLTRALVASIVFKHRF